MGLEVLDAALLQPEGNVFGPASRVREDEGRAMLVDQLAEEVIHPSIRDLHRYGGYVTHRTQDREVEVLPRVDLDDVHVSDLAVLVARQEFRFLLDRRDRRAQADPHEVAPSLLAKTLEANREQRTAFGGADLMDFVEDDPLDVREAFTEFRGAEDDRDALGRRDEDVWRVTDLSLAFLRGCIAGADADPDERDRLALLLGQLRQLTKRFLGGAVDVVRERLERGDVQAKKSNLRVAPGV